MKTIIPAVDPSLIEQELTSETFVRKSNKADNQIFVVDAHTAPHTMREIGRLREITFREAGGGTGKECDIDEFDTMERPCRQLIVWNPERREILGGYRYLLGEDMVVADGVPHIAMTHIFNFSPQFVSDVLPHTIELGRSFVTPFYQSSRAGARAIFALDNLWDGLGALVVLHPEIEYLFGKMTMYTTYPRHCRNLLLHFLGLYFPDPDGWATPIVPLAGTEVAPEVADFFAGNDFKEDYRRLKQYVRSHGINIPPLVNSYMNLSPTMRILGTAINDAFGDVEETGLIIKVDEIAPGKRDRHINTFEPQAAATAP
ncbi:MAG: GNAT family N-acetyltransferase [Muribaculaceae bacterium]|nr:GNAT family N-acetyltransferase [Muribaculaceae bacterium]